jgi:hypothetical protein
VFRVTGSRDQMCHTCSARGVPNWHVIEHRSEAGVHACAEQKPLLVMPFEAPHPAATLNFL